MSLSIFNLGGYFDFTGGIHLESLLIICKALIDVRRRPACLVTSFHLNIHQRQLVNVLLLRGLKVKIQFFWINRFFSLRDNIQICIFGVGTVQIKGTDWPFGPQDQGESDDIMTESGWHWMMTWILAQGQALAQSDVETVASGKRFQCVRIHQHLWDVWFLLHHWVKWGFNEPTNICMVYIRPFGLLCRYLRGYWPKEVCVGIGWKRRSVTLLLPKISN